jgi:hypothetical protein
MMSIYASLRASITMLRSANSAGSLMFLFAMACMLPYPGFGSGLSGDTKECDVSVPQQICAKFADMMTTCLPGRDAPLTPSGTTTSVVFGRKTERFLRPTLGRKLEFSRFCCIAYSLGPPSPESLVSLYVFEAKESQDYKAAVAALQGTSGSLVTKAPHLYRVRLITNALVVIVIEEWNGPSETRQALLSLLDQL